MPKDFGGIIINPSCENHCVFCRRVPTATAKEIKQQELNIFKSLVDFKNKNIRKIEISGADPIEYSKLISLVKYIKRSGFRLIQLSSHGNYLSNKKFTDSLIEAGVNKFRIPIYGSTNKIHDQVTRNQGSFHKIIQGIKHIKKNHPYVKIQISCLIVRQNKEDLKNIIDLIIELDITDFYFSIPCIKDTDADFDHYYLPIKDLPPYVQKTYNYCREKKLPAQFMEIPFCVFGFGAESITNNSKPPDHSHCQPKKELQTKEKDLPSYRIKKKLPMCNKCQFSNKCEGFFQNDIDLFGPGDLQPL